MELTATMIYLYICMYMYVYILPYELPAISKRDDRRQPRRNGVFLSAVEEQLLFVL